MNAVSRPRADRPEIRTLSIADLRVLFEATKRDRLHALWVLLATTGLRLGEALGLAWKDIDLLAGRLPTCLMLHAVNDRWSETSVCLGRSQSIVIVASCCWR